MEMSRYSIVMAIAGTMTLMVASLIVWLVVTEPVALATSLNEQDVTDLAHAIGKALAAGLRALAEYL
jgi:uncharacterized membrane-anchored protein